MMPIVPIDVGPVAHGLAVTRLASPVFRLTQFELAFALLEFVFCLAVIVAARRLDDRDRHVPTTHRPLPRAA